MLNAKDIQIQILAYDGLAVFIVAIDGLESGMYLVAYFRLC